MREGKVITEEKVVLQATQSIWAKNKYFILACSQQDYREVRKLLREEYRDLPDAYNALQKVEEIFGDVPSAELPQVSNALYHMAGYFKKLISREDRQAMNALIQTNPSKVLDKLEINSRDFKIDYLLNSRIWPSLRKESFNLVPITLMCNGITYQTGELLWQGNYLTVK